MFVYAGGTESILLAIKAARDYMAESRGITCPEMVVGPSAHAAYWKAAEYFNIKLVQAPLGKDFRWGCWYFCYESCGTNCAHVTVLWLMVYVMMNQHQAGAGAVGQGLQAGLILVLYCYIMKGARVVVYFMIDQPQAGAGAPGQGLQVGGFSR